MWHMGSVKYSLKYEAQINEVYFVNKPNILHTPRTTLDARYGAYGFTQVWEMRDV